MAPTASITARDGTTTVIASPSSANLSTGAIVGVLMGSILGIVALCVCVYCARKRCNYVQTLERRLRATAVPEQVEDDILRRASANHTRKGSRTASHNHVTGLGAEWERSRSSPNTAASKSARLHENNANQGQMRIPPVPGMHKALSYAGLRRSGQSEAAYDMTASDFERLAFSDPGTASRGPSSTLAGPSRPLPALTRTGTLSTHVEDKEDGADTEFWRTPYGDEITPDQSLSNMPTRRVMVRRKPVSPAKAESSRAKHFNFKSERDVEKNWDKHWRDEMEAERSRPPPVPATPSGSPRFRPEPTPRETNRQRLERIEREIANLKRTEITRRAEIELEERRSSPKHHPSAAAAGAAAVAKPKERSRVEQWIHNTTKPSLNHVPIGDGSEFLSDITTRSALEFPRWGESVASVLGDQSAALSFDPWRDEVREDHGARTGS